MKLYHTAEGIVIVREHEQFLLRNESWDTFINDDDLYNKVLNRTQGSKPQSGLLQKGLRAPLGTQEVWAAGVTYYRSKVGRQEESKNAGGGDFYARVYEAERPELFFKSPA